jgi:hypothetical protein
MSPDFDKTLPPWLRGDDGLPAALDRFYADMLADETSVQRYFAPTYVQHANGDSMDYEQFLEHLDHLRRFGRRVVFKVAEAVDGGGVIAERHIVELIDQDNEQSLIETFCFIRFANGRIAQIHELYRVISGEAVMARFAAGA